MKQEKMSEFENELFSSYQTIESFFDYLKGEKLYSLWYSGCLFSTHKLENVDISDLKLKGYYQLSKECLETSSSMFVYQTTLSVLGLEQNRYHYELFKYGYDSVLESVEHSFENKIYKIEDVNDEETWEDFCKWVLYWSTSNYYGFSMG